MRIELDTSDPLKGDCPRFIFDKPGRYDVIVNNKSYPVKVREDKLKLNAYDIHESIGANYFQELQIKVIENIGKEHNIIFEEECLTPISTFINREMPIICIRFDTKALGDTIAFMSAVRVFHDKYGKKCRIIVSTYMNYLFEDEFPDIVFMSPSDKMRNADRVYCIRDHTDPQPKYSRISYLDTELVDTAYDILGINKPKECDISRMNLVSSMKIKVALDKFVVITEVTSTRLKDFKGNWQIICDHINSLGYAVVVIGKEYTFLESRCKLKGHNLSVFDVTGENDLRSLVYILSKAKLFIGGSTGLTWLAFASGCETLLISDITPIGHESCTYRLGGENLKKVEYREPEKRVTTEEVITKINSILI